VRRQGMAQDSGRRPPPGHAQSAPRHFVSDAVVFAIIRLPREGHPPGGAPDALSSETCPALPQQSARLARGDTRAVLAFVRTYACWAMRRWQPPSAVACPATRRAIPGLDLAQAETVTLWPAPDYGLQAGDDAALQQSLRAVQLPQPPRPTAAPAHCPPRSGSAAGRHQLGVADCTAPEDWRAMPVDP